MFSSMTIFDCSLIICDLAVTDRIDILKASWSVLVCEKIKRQAL